MVETSLNCMWNVKISHVYREENRCANILANMRSSSSTTTMVNNHTPQELI